MTQPRFISNGPLDRANFAFDGSIEVNAGDLMFHDTDDVKPASSMTDQTSESLNQNYFAARFAGVAMDSRKTADGAVTDFPVATDVVAEYDCASSTFEIGDLLAIDEAGSGTALEDQKLVKTTEEGKAIGVCTKRYASAVTRVQCRLISRVLPNGNPATTPVVNVTATADGLTTGLIPSWARLVVAGSGNNAHIITLPPPVIGKELTITPTAICELQTVAASGATINGADSDGTNSLALAANAVYELKCTSATGWVAYGWTSAGAAIATLTPD